MAECFDDEKLHVHEIGGGEKGEAGKRGDYFEDRFALGHARGGDAGSIGFLQIEIKQR